MIRWRVILNSCFFNIKYGRELFLLNSFGKGVNELCLISVFARVLKNALRFLSGNLGLV